MRLQKWLVRGWVFTTLAAMAVAALAYHRWTDPVIVRQEVAEKLEEQFPGADVTLEAARLRILGGILLTDLRLFRRDDNTRTDVAYIPSAVVYHDKERLLDGKISFRKVELHRPRLRVIREPDGRWNLAGLTGPARPDLQLPTVVVHEGTLTFEDRLADPGLPPLELTDVTLTLINDPLPVLAFEGTGVSQSLGKVTVAGTWERASGRLDAAVKAEGVHVSPQLVRRAAGYCPEGDLSELYLEGWADVDVKFARAPAPGVPLDYNVSVRLRGAKCRHPKLVFDLDDLEVSARCANGRLTLERLTAAAGVTRVEAHGAAMLPCPTEQFEGAVVLRHVPVGEELCGKCPGPVQSLHRLFRPRGPMTVELQARRRLGVWERKTCRVRPEQMHLSFAHFPYPVPNVTGSVDVDLLAETAEVDLAAKLGAQEVALAGTWRGWGEDKDVDLRLTARRVPLDATLAAALPADLRELAESFQPAGLADVDAAFRRTPGSGKFRNEYHARFYQTAVRWKPFPLPLGGITGRLDVYPDHWEFHDFEATHGRGRVLVSGRSAPAGGLYVADSPEAAESRVVIDIVGENIAIDRDLRTALTEIPDLARAWDILAPAGQLSFRARVDRVPGRPQDLDIALNVAGCRIEPTFYKYRLSDLSGAFRYHGNRLELKGIKARHGASTVRIGRGRVDLAPGGGYYADLEDVQGDPVYPDDGFVAAMPAQLRDVFEAVALKDPIAFQTRLVVAQAETPGTLPDVFWDGTAWVRKARLRLGLDVEKVTGEFAFKGRHNGHRLLGLTGNVLLSEGVVYGQPLGERVHAHAQIHPRAPDVLTVNLHAPFFGGDVSGQARVDFHSTMRYEMNLTAAQIDLEKFGRHNLGADAQLKGLASGRLHLTGQGTSVETLEGNGTVDVPEGNLYNLPFLLDLLKFLGLRWPDRTAFEEAHAAYSISGNRLKIHKLDLWGNAISLTGHGEVNLDGTDVQLDFYPSWARVEQLLPAALRSVSPALSKTLLKIEVRGELGKKAEDLKFHKRPVPVLVDPILGIRDRVSGARGGRPAAQVTGRREPME